MKISNTAFKLDFDDKTLFGNDAGEDEDLEVLASYFVDQHSFRPFLDRETKLQIARSRKGMGKSALLSKLNHDLNGEDVLIVRLTGSQLASSVIPSFENLLEAQNYWVSQICSRVNAALGSAIGFAFTDTDIALVEAAEVTGLKEKNLIGSLLTRIKVKNFPIEVLSPTAGAENAEALLKRASESRIQQTVWLLVDDVDASFKDTEKQQLIVSSFFSACRFVAREMKGIHIRTTVRSDVWSNLRSNEDLDKCEQYITDIRWSKKELKSILSKKVFSWIERKFPSAAKGLSLNFRTDADSIIEIAFDRRMKWGEHMVPAFQAINILSGGRPRWMAQLCRMAGMHAAKERRWRVSIIDINAVMADYARSRLNDLYKEHSHQFAHLERLVQVFAGGPVRYTTDELMSCINRKYVGAVGVLKVPAVDGEDYNSPLQLAHLLFKSGYLIARSDNGDDARNATFLTHSQSPELLKYVAESQGFLWEIYPSYRQRIRVKDIEVSYVSLEGDESVGEVVESDVHEP